MFCPACGGRNEPDDAFCRWCGRPLPADTRTGPAEPGPPPPAPGTRRRPRALLVGFVVLAALVTLVVAGSLVLRSLPRGEVTAESQPQVPYGMVPDLPAGPSRAWSLTASGLTTTCSDRPSDYVAGPDRQCELTVGEWPDGRLVATLSKGRPGQFQVSELAGVAPDTGATLWRVGDGLLAHCTAPSTGLLACVDVTSSRVFRLDPESGEELWSTPFDGQAAAVDAVGGDVYVFAPTDDGTSVVRFDPNGKLRWTSTAPRSFSFTPGEGKAVNLYESVVHAGQLQDDDGRLWAVTQDEGTPVSEADSVLAVRDGVALTRGADGQLDAAGTPLNSATRQPGADLPTLVLPDAASSALPAWVVAVPGSAEEGTTYKYFDVADVTNYRWKNQAPPVAWCGDQWVTYDQAAGTLQFWTRLGGAGADVTLLGGNGFVCDGSRVIVTDTGGLTAFDGSSENPVWQVDVPHATGAAGSSHGVLVTQSNAMEVSLWR